jgi:SAM-dependent methyltransferase
MDLKKHYDTYYSGPSEWRELSALDKVANIDDLWNRHRPSAREPRVVEIGCGEGSVLEQLRDRGYRARGLELSSSGAAVARSRGLEVDIYDGVRLPYEQSSFDLAILTHVVEHLENPRLILAEAARVAPWVFVEVPLEYGWRTPDDFVWTELGHINLYDRKLIRHLLQSTGLQVIDERIGGPSVELHRFRRGAIKGTIVWGLREGARIMVPPIAWRIFTYHGAFLCRVESDTNPSKANP